MPHFPEPPPSSWTSFWQSVLLAALLFLFLGWLEAALAPDPFMERQVTFTEAWKSWARQGNHLSSASPDYGDKVREIWLTEEVGEKFRRFETALEGLR